MEIKYGIGKKLFCLDEDGVNTSKVKECLVTEEGVTYKIETPQGEKQVKEDALMEQLSDDISGDEEGLYYIKPNGIRYGHDYQRDYDEYSVYRLKTADISVLRKVGDKYPSTFEFRGVKIGTMPKKIMEKVGIRTPSVTDTKFFKVDEDDLITAINKFNTKNISKEVMRFLKPTDVKADTEMNVLSYSKKLEDMVLKLNPEIKNTYIELKDVDEMKDMIVEDGYALNNNFVITKNEEVMPEVINYKGMVGKRVKLDLIKKYEQKDSKTLPSYYVYDILGFEDIGVGEIAAASLDTMQNEIDDMIKLIEGYKDTGHILSYLNNSYSRLSPAKQMLSALLEVAVKNKKPEESFYRR